MAVEMLIVHNVFLRGINGIYRQCVNVERDPGAATDLVNYAGIRAELVEEHHHTEEEDVFPQLEALVGKPGLMEANVEQHKAFHDGLVEYSRYVKAVQAGDETYDGQKLRDILDGFMPTLRQHFVDEIDTLLRLDEYEDKADLKKWYDDIQKLIQKKQDLPGVKVCFLFLSKASHIYSSYLTCRRRSTGSCPSSCSRTTPHSTAASTPTGRPSPGSPACCSAGSSCPSISIGGASLPAMPRDGRGSSSSPNETLVNMLLGCLFFFFVAVVVLLC